MNSVIVWYLVIALYKGGIVSIPQPSLPACQASAHWIDDRRDFPGMTGQTAVAWCVQGLKP